MKKKLALLLCAAMCMMMLPACGNSAPKPEDPQTPSSQESVTEAGGHVELLRLGTTDANDNFNATQQTGILGHINYIGFCQGNMFVRDEQGSLVPYMIKDYSISEDSKTLTLTIPTNVTWHDGQPLTIDDLLFTFQFKAKFNLSPVSRYYQQVEKLEVQGDDTLVVTFKDGLTAFAFLNRDSMSRIYPKHIWENVENPAEYMGDDRNIGCGPYKLVELDKDAQTSYYEAVPDFWKGELMVDKVSIRTYANQEALVMGLSNDEIDAIYDYSKPISTNLYETVEKNEDLDLGLAEHPGNKMLMMGFRVAPTNDLAFREAISYAIDYEMLAMTVGGKYATVGHRGVVPSANASYYNPDLPQMETNFEKAAQMLDAAGYVDADGDGWRDLKDGSPMDVSIVPQCNKSRAEIMIRIGDILVDSFEKVHVKATFNEECLTNKEAWSKIAEEEGSYNIHLGFCTSGLAAYIGVPNYLIDSSINNWWGTCNDEEFLASYDKLFGAKNYEEYKTHMYEIQKIIADKVIAIPTCWETAAFPYRTDRYEGWVNRPGEGVINCNTWFNLHTK